MEGLCLSQNIHPLLIDHVLEKILENFVHENESFLLKSRLVCNQWNLLTSKSLQKYSDVVISFGKFFHSAESMQDFFKVVQNSLAFPILNFRLCQDIFQPHNESLLKDFFRKCNPILSSLIIRLDHESTIQVDDKWLSLLSLPRLKTLVYDDRRNLTDAFDKYLLSALLNSSPNLETLSLHQQMESQIRFEEIEIKEAFMQRVCDIITNYQIPNLTNLQIDVEISDKLLSCLSLNLKGIRNLSLCLRTSNFHQDSLYSLLKSQAKSLEKLKLGGICRKSSFEIKFPKLQELESLEIHGWDASVPEVHFSKLSYRENFPSLKTLILNTWVDEPSWHQIFKNQNDSLKRLKLPQQLFHQGLIQDMKLSFGNLRSLELHYTEDAISVFEKVFEYLVQLEELKINKDFRGLHQIKYIDSLLTGLPQNVCKRMLRRRNFQQEFPTSLRVNAKPGLANLENLKVLDMKDLLKYQASITDVSGYLVFLRMKNLQRLKICKSQVQHECLTLLSKRFPLDLQDELEQSSQDIIPNSAYYDKSMINYCTIC